MEFKVFYPEIEQQTAHKAMRAHTSLHKRRGIVCRTSNNKSDIVQAIEMFTGKNKRLVELKRSYVKYYPQKCIRNSYYLFLHS